MKIGIDARFYGPLGKGLGIYTMQLIKHLEKIDKINTYYIFLRGENFSTYNPSSDNFKKIKADYRWYTVKEQIFFCQFLKKFDLDLMHFLHFNVPYFYNKPYIVTIHDLILLSHPTRKASKLSFLFYKIKYFAYKKVIKKAILKASHIMTVSSYTKKQINRYFNVDEHNISVSYEAAGQYQSCNTVDTNLLQKNNITKPYFLYVGNAYPHKNLETLLESFALYKKGGGIFQLVLVGKIDYFYERLIMFADNLSLQIGKDVLFFGYAKKDELCQLYAHANAYIFLSLEEGFGIPPLEALSYEKLVISSYLSCLPEILQDKVLYVNPYNVQEISFMLQLTQQESNLISVNNKELEIFLKRFSWDTCAKETLGVYNEIYASRGNINK